MAGKKRGVYTAYLKLKEIQLEMRKVWRSYVKDASVVSLRRKCVLLLIFGKIE